MAMATNILKVIYKLWDNEFVLKGTLSELSLLKRHPSEKIFGVQLAGGYPDSLSKVVQIIKENFETDFIDLNLVNDILDKLFKIY